jgi:inner membrane protein
MQLETWQWVVGAVAMAMMELAIPAFVLIWFALGALVVAFMLLVFPALGLTWQLTIWLIASLAMVYWWFKIFKPSYRKTLVGTADANVIGEIGLLAREVAPYAKGEVRFQKPLLGTDTWPCIADNAIAAGERVKVVAVEGSMLKIEKI